MKKLFYLLLISCFSLPSQAQSDSSILQIYRLQVADIEKVKGDSLVQQVISATRSAIPLSQSPFETYVITKEEIQRFGCNTLIDVLRLVPGIRTSKVGSAMEGELFMANGLRGNSYFQFLINDVPIRPFSIVGMSIGAQFPIKQAERIEIQLGNCATLYGSQAGGGVVNIILKESERPVYTSADLTFGSDKYNNIDVNFGGKIGKGKRIFRFNAYGGFTTMNDVRNKKEYDINYAAEVYDPALTYREGKNYIYSDALSVAKAKLPHFSRYFGFDLKGKNFFISYIDMTRRDHSAIGLNPSVISYEDGGAYIEDNISQLTAGMNLKFSKFRLKSCIGFLNYHIANGSSASYYNPIFRSTLDSLINLSKQTGIKIENIDFIKSSLIDSRSYISAEETSLPFQTTISYSFLKGLEGSLGLNSILFPFVENIERYTTITNDFVPHSTWLGNITMNANLMYRNEKTFITSNYALHIGDFGFQRSFRLGLDQRFKIYNNDLHLKLNSAIGEVYPSLYNFQANRGIRFSNGSFPTPAWESSQPNSYYAGSGNLIAQPLVNLGAALAYQYQYANFTLRYQYAALKKLYSYYALKKIDNPNSNLSEIEYINGFQNVADTYRKIHKVSFVNTIKKDFTKYYKSGFWQSSFAYTHFIGEEKLEDGVIPIIRQTPKYLLQYNTYIQPAKSFLFGCNFNLTGVFYPSKTTAAVYLKNKESLIAARFSSLDVFVNYHFNDNLQGQLRIFNLMNNRNTGIEATETPDDLFFNTQPLRTLQLGLKYNLDRQ